MNARSLGPLVFLVSLLCADVGHAGMAACTSASRKASLDDQIRLYTLCIANGQMRRADLGYALERRALAYLRKGELDRALEDANQSLVYNPTAVYPHQLRGYIHANRMQWDLAEQEFTTLIELEHASRYRQAYAYAVRGEMRVCRGSCADALGDFDRVLEIYPKGNFVYGAKAWVLSTCSDERVRNGGEAVSLAQRALSLRDEWRSHATLAAAFAEAGQFADSVREVSLAQTLMKAETPTSRRLLAEQRALYENGRPYRAQSPNTNCFPLPENDGEGSD
jgi:tetratricopeptide (TPR) repeat protein